jgi:NAD(P)-dependent dehydrogenase (short-subunit alcohol dehydrogenase family)
MPPVRTYVVTGSASGIGAATCARLRSAGHRVIGVDRHRADVEVDLATTDGRAALGPAVRDLSGGPVDAVVAGAGISQDGPLTIAVNFFGAVATLASLRPLLAAGQQPRAVAIASIASLLGGDEAVVDACLAGDEAEALRLTEAAPSSAYFSSKRALARWIRRHAAGPDWAGAGIALNAVAPGTVRTPMTEELLATPEGAALADAAVPMPLHGHAPPEAVAAALDFLTRPDTTHVTGQVLFVDGGADAVIRGDSTW